MSSVGTILIVDDEVDLLEMYKDFLESEGLRVVTASSGEEGLKAIEEHPEIKLIISDSHMGKMSGLEFLKHLKESKNSNLPFYLATGDMNKDEEELKKLGVSRLIIKPFDLDDLINKIKEDVK